MFTNEYDTMVWPGDKQPMVLKGAIKDRDNAQMFLDQFTPGIRVVGSKSGNLNALREDIEDGLEEVMDSCPPLVVAYFQGHSEGGTESLRCLQYCLYVSSDGKSFLWYETDEWFKDNRDGQKHRIIAPMACIRLFYRAEQVYETEKRGGYLTNVATLKAESTTIPQFLLGIRQGVESHLEQGRARASKPLPKEATQQPQIYCTHKLPLDNSDIFSRIYLKTVETFNSISD
ncbi:hypothetical protein FRC11_012387 [Ceratobasidium sp. 423]|nr:hypothetical protein FRC11_012387 [Ceratobasidium sp. 423]